MLKLVSPDIHTEWMTVGEETSQSRHLRMTPQRLLKELATNGMLDEMIPHLTSVTLLRNLLLIPAGTALVERKFLSNEDDQNKAEESRRTKPNLIQLQ